jgi:hypothetical protein
MVVLKGGENICCWKIMGGNQGKCLKNRILGGRRVMSVGALSISQQNWGDEK